jgi:hypothetical protein
MSSSTLSATYIFNQYYIDLLKKVKVIAKKHRLQSETAKKVLKAIKDNYHTYDKTSSEYVDFFKEKCNTEFWSEYIALDKDKCNEWLKDDTKNNVEIYKTVSLKDIVKLLRNNFIIHHYLSVLYIYTIELKEEEITDILKYLQSVTDEPETEIELNVENENIKTVLKRLNDMKGDNIKSSMPNMDSLKDTTIGKIAKEIIDGVDLTKIKQSITDEGDIFKAIAKPDSGFGELFTNVSQKMSSKISSGELSQEAIMQDAMKFASILPGLFGGGGGGSGDGGDNDGGMNMAMNMMNMMKMMNQGGGMGGMGGMGGGGGKKSRTGVDNSALRKLMKKQQLKEKLNSRT